MSDYIITCSSTVDLSNEYMQERGIPYVCFHFELGGLEYPDDMGRTVSPEQLFQRMAAGADTKTSQVTLGEYILFFEKYLQFPERCATIFKLSIMDVSRPWPRHHKSNSPGR